MLPCKLYAGETRRPSPNPKLSRQPYETGNNKSKNGAAFFPFLSPIPSPLKQFWRMSDCVQGPEVSFHTPWPACIMDPCPAKYVRVAAGYYGNPGRGELWVSGVLCKGACRDLGSQPGKRCGKRELYRRVPTSHTHWNVPVCPRRLPSISHGRPVPLTQGRGVHFKVQELTTSPPKHAP